VIRGEIMNTPNKDTAVLLINCPDRKGIVYAVCDFVLNNNGNIIELDQHVDRDESYFFMRIEWELSDFAIPKDKIGEFFDTLIAKKFDLNWHLHFRSLKPRMAIFVSKYAHCIHDILSRYESGEWNVEIPMIISNHEKFRILAEQHGIAFHYFPINKENKATQEAAEIALLKKEKIDFIILARYMQILSPTIIEAFPMKIINIHHSSLPAFAGANPYKAAYMRGVKFMGATAHYVTEMLDEGPIIAQDVTPISHRDSIADMKRKGRDVEKIVLANAIWSHINHNILTYKNKTVVFDS
jgi:formyltetrahydrofolate deformylase